MHQTFTITEIHCENYRTKTLVFDRSLPSEPGQFVMAWLPTIDERPYSIAGADPFSMTVVAVGPFSEALHALQLGDRVWIRGPLGQGFRLPAQVAGEYILLAGGGYGVAPLCFLAQRAVRRSKAEDLQLQGEASHLHAPQQNCIVGHLCLCPVEQRIHLLDNGPF